MPTESLIPSYARICKQCGSITKTADSLPGSGWIELILWLCYLVPGVIYSIWRRAKKNVACTACASRELVNVTSPVGERLVREYHGGVKVSAVSSAELPKRQSPPISGTRIAGAIGAVILLVLALAFVVGVFNRLTS